MRAHDIKRIKKSTHILKCLAHPLRLSLLCHLSAARELSAGKLVKLEKRHGGQSQISQYLGQLRRLGLVKTRRKGQVIYYKLTSPVAKDLLRVLTRHYGRKQPPPKQNRRKR